MEEKRTIWIIAAVGIFLGVVLLSARLLSRGQTKERVQVAYKNNNQDASSGWSKSTDDEDNKEEISTPVTQVSDMTVIANNATVFAIEREQKDFPDNKYSIQPPQDTEGTAPIDLNKIGASKGEDNAVAKTDESKTVQDGGFDSIYVGTAKEEPAKESEKKAVSNAEKAKAAPVVKKVVTENKATAKAPAPKKAAQKSEAVPASWWVQAASFTSLKHADRARDTLGENNINADVFTYKDSFGKVFYRVRVGPYLTKSEAEYWQSRIGQIQTFATTQSFVTRG